MGWFDRLFSKAPRPGNKLFAGFKRKSRAPTDPDLLKIAKDRKGHISRKAVHAEYSRLIQEKYADDKA
jgi:hypothetical protein